MTIVLTIFGIIAASLVAYAVFLLPHRTDWEAVSNSLSIYETPQSFTETGLEAEWGTPRSPEMPKLEMFSQPGHNNVVYAVPVEPPMMVQGRRARKSTVLGVVPAQNNSIPGVTQINRAELANLVRANLCEPDCTIFVQQDNLWLCQCGAVTKHANHTTGMTNGLRIGVAK